MDYTTLFPVIKIFMLTAGAFVIAFLCTPILSHFLYKYKLGKPIRNGAFAPVFAKLHAKKSGTPTMGGILIWVTVLLIALVFYYLAELFPESAFAQFNFLDRGQTLLPLGALIASSLAGL